jgi:4-hydroxybenzoate polyprenyltransferase
LVATLPGAIIAGVAIVFVVMTLRNLVGDVRDAAKDSAEGIQSLPVVFGYKKSTHLIYPCSLALTSTLWTVLGDLPWWALAVALLVEVSTYGRTPR